MEKIDKIWDVLIVGAGILGTSIAKTLKERNPEMDILLIDKHPAVGQGNTSKSNACYRNVFSNRANIKMCNSSIDYYKYLEESGYNLELQEFGYLWLLSQEQSNYLDDQTLQNSEKKKTTFFEYLEMNKVDFRIINLDEIQQFLPNLQINPKSSEYFKSIKIVKGLLGKKCGTLSPDLLVKTYEILYSKMGGQKIFNLQVVSILLKEVGKEYEEDYQPTIWRETDVAGIKVKDVEGKFYNIFGKKVILATGAWINQLLDPLGIDSMIKPKKRQLFRICNLNELVRNINFNDINSLPFIILPIGGVFIKPIYLAGCADVGCSDDLGRRFETRIPANHEINTDFNPFLDDPKGEIDFYLTDIQPILEMYFPNDFSNMQNIEKPSAGMYAYSFDKNPIIEKVEDVNNLYFCSGASGSGIMKADSIARIMSSLILNEKEALLYNGEKVITSDFGLHDRKMEKERMVL